jgi:hypothetical protein
MCVVTAVLSGLEKTSHDCKCCSSKFPFESSQKFVQTHQVAGALATPSKGRFDIITLEGATHGSSREWRRTVIKRCTFRGHPGFPRGHIQLVEVLPNL